MIHTTGNNYAHPDPVTHAARVDSMTVLQCKAGSYMFGSNGTLFKGLPYTNPAKYQKDELPTYYYDFEGYKNTPQNMAVLTKPTICNGCTYGANGSEFILPGNIYPYVATNFLENDEGYLGLKMPDNNTFVYVWIWVQTNHHTITVKGYGFQRETPLKMGE